MNRYIVLEAFTGFYKGHPYLVVPTDFVEIKRIAQGIAYAALSIFPDFGEVQEESLDIEFPCMYAIPNEWMVRFEGDNHEH